MGGREVIYDDRACELGEGVLWHPERGQLFWVDIIRARLMSRGPDGPEEWVFPEMISALGWVDRDRLVIAGESGLWRFDLATGERDLLAAVDYGPGMRSNDGRADRQGGFWWGSMAKSGAGTRGAIWRFFRGQVRRLFTGLAIPNATCFTADGRTAYFADTLSHQVMRVALDADGWPVGEPSVFLDLTEERLLPDGAVIDAEGALWLAQWSAGRVAVYDPDGRFRTAHAVGGPQSTCPAFGGADLTTLYVTSALQDMDKAARAAHPQSGCTFAIAGAGRGLPEPKVTL